MMTIFKSLGKKDSESRFKAIFKTYYPDCYKFAKFKLNDAEKAEDLVQEAMMRLWKNFSKAEVAGNLKSYIFSILNNLIIDEYRKKKFDAVEEFDETKSSTSDHQNEWVQQVVSELPDDLRTVFIMNKYNGFKYIEIAEIVGVSVKTVEARMSKALKMLKEKIKNE